MPNGDEETKEEKDRRGAEKTVNFWKKKIVPGLAWIVPVPYLRGYLRTKAATLRETMFEVESETTELLKKLDAEGIIDKMTTLNKNVIGLEKDYWNAQFESYISRVLTPFKTVGPYTTVDTMKEERDYYGYGTVKQKPKGGDRITKDNVYDYMGKARIAFLGKVFDFPMPIEKKIADPGGSEYYLRTWGGTYNYNIWREVYKEIVPKVIDHAGEYYLTKWKEKIKSEEIVKEMSEEERGKITTSINDNIEALKTAYDTIIDEVFNRIHEDENKFRITYTEMFSAFGQQSNEVQTFLNKKNTSQAEEELGINVHCKHTYTVIARTETIVNNKVRKLNIPKWEWEKAVGLDHVGMPLEVGKDEHGKYIILLDKWMMELWSNKKMRENRGEDVEWPTWLYNTPHIRKISQEDYKDFVTPLDLMQQYIHIHNEWDRIRDDLRDGRYHHRCLTIYDYILAAQREKVETDVDKEKEKIRLTPELYKDKLLELGAGAESQKIANEIRSYVMELRQGERTWKVTGKRMPSNFNPAFDKRALGIEKPTFPGTIYYYGTPPMVDCDILSDELQPHITSRGTAMYVIDMAMRGIKFMDQIHRFLLEVSGKTNGFDYGPRVYSTDMRRDPFDVNVEALQKIEEGERAADAVLSGNLKEGDSDFFAD